MEIDSADTGLPPNGEICMHKSHLLPNNPARQQYRYTSVPIEAAGVFLQGIQQDIQKATKLKENYVSKYTFKINTIEQNLDL